eukprot:5792451-Pleurochrysis_carterae.AAC.1
MGLHARPGCHLLVVQEAGGRRLVLVRSRNRSSFRSSFRSSLPAGVVRRARVLSNNPDPVVDGQQKCD